MIKMKTLMNRINNGVTKGWNLPNTSPDVKKYESGPFISILNALGAIATGYLMRYYVLGYNIYLIYIAIFIALWFFISHIYVTIDRFKAINNLLKNKELDIKNPELDQLVVRSARFAIWARVLILQIKPLWIIVGLIVGYNTVIEKAPEVERILDLIRGPFSEIEKNNKDIKELRKLIKAAAEWGITDNSMKKDAIEVIKQLEKEKADIVKSNCKLMGEIVYLLKKSK